MTLEEIDIMKEGAQILGQVHGLISRAIAPGVATIALDKAAHDYILSKGGSPSFLGFKGFAYTLCISVNEVVVHGFPGSYTLKEGDIISVDCGVFYKGYHSDSAYTYTVGEVAPEVLALLKATRQSLDLGIAQCRAGNRVGDIGYAIQTYVESKGYSVVRELVGHGVGKRLHEKPEVPNYGSRGRGPKLIEGMVIAIEPMINLGKKAVVQEKDGWTIRTTDRKHSAHFEHTVAIVDGEPDVVTTFQYLEPKYLY
jgi:methionyl aminopeptidase